MQPEGDRPPFFYVSPFLITVLSFAHLARCMRARPAVLRASSRRGWRADHPVHDRVEDMAAHYISEMRQVQPTGPYRIGGHCAGALGGVRDGPAAAGRRRRGGAAAGRRLGAAEHRTTPRRLLRYVVDRLRHYWRDGRVIDSIRWQLRVRRERHISRRFGAREPPAPGRSSATPTPRPTAATAPGSFDGDLVLVRSQDWAGRPREGLAPAVAGAHHGSAGRRHGPTAPTGTWSSNASSAALADRIRSAVDRVDRSPSSLRVWSPLRWLLELATSAAGW